VVATKRPVVRSTKSAGFMGCLALEGAIGNH
jgi:hypothetical protein